VPGVCGVCGVCGEGAACDASVQLTSDINKNFWANTDWLPFDKNGRIVGCASAAGYDRASPKIDRESATRPA